MCPAKCVVFRAFDGSFDIKSCERGPVHGSVKCQTPLHRRRLRSTDTTNRHHQRTSSQQVVDVVQHVRSRRNLLFNILPATDMLYNTPTDELTTILQLVVQQIHHQRTKICHIPTSWHVETLGSVALRCGKFLSVGGEFVVQQVVE